jgi:hypothetical protein
MSDYKLLQGDGIQRLSDMACIPPDPNNFDYSAYIEWKNAGNIPEPADVPVIDNKSLALVALDTSDTTALRCFKAGVAFPVEWQNYTASLRGIVKSDIGPIPARPAYPAGT